MKSLKSIIAALVLITGTLTIASAQTRVHVSLNAPGIHIGVGNYHPYHAYYEPVVYRHSYYAPIVYHRYYGRPVYRGYDRRAYAKPVYHREYRR